MRTLPRGAGGGLDDPANPPVHNGVTYLFSSAEAKAMFDKDPEGTVAKADKAWPTIH